MMIKQMRELERQGNVLEEARINKALRELKCIDEMYYVGDIVDLDNDGWVDKEKAVEVIKSIKK